MTYRATSESSTQTDTERADEARRILAMGLLDMASRDEMQPKEAAFVLDQVGRLDAGIMPSVKQLWWLRDLKEKYL